MQQLFEADVQGSRELLDELVRHVEERRDFNGNAHSVTFSGDSAKISSLFVDRSTVVTVAELLRAAAEYGESAKLVSSPRRRTIAPLPVHYGRNPFVSRTSWKSPCELFKIVLFTFTGIAPLRMVLVFLSVVLLWFFCLLANCCARPLFSLLVRLVARVLLFVCGFYWVPTNGRTPRRARVLVVTPHSTPFDAFKIYFDTGCCFAAKKELFSAPLVGTMLKATRCIPIDRNTPEGRSRAKQDILDHANSPAESGLPPLLVFPAGTTHCDDVIVKFKVGAFIAGAPVAPVALRYERNTRHDMLMTVEWSELWTLYWTCCQFINFMTVDYLPEWEPTPEEAADPSTYARNVRTSLAKHMGVPTAEFDYADVRLLIRARRLKVNLNVVNGQVKEQLGFTSAETEFLMRRFRELAPEKGGTLSYALFCRSLRLSEAHPLSQKLFLLFDSDHDDQIDFAEFLAAISVVTKDVNDLESLRVLFELSDLEDRGYVTRAGFLRLLRFAAGRYVAGEPPAEDEQHDHDVDDEDALAERLSAVQASADLQLGEVIGIVFPDEDKSFSDVREDSFLEDAADDTAHMDDDGVDGLDFRAFTVRFHQKEQYAHALLRLFFLKRLVGMDDSSLRQQRLLQGNRASFLFQTANELPA